MGWPLEEVPWRGQGILEIITYICTLDLRVSWYMCCAHRESKFSYTWKQHWPVERIIPYKLMQAHKEGAQLSWLEHVTYMGTVQSSYSSVPIACTGRPGFLLCGCGHSRLLSSSALRVRKVRIYSSMVVYICLVADGLWSQCLPSCFLLIGVALF